MGLKVASVLEKAKAKLEKYGWVQGKMGSTKCGFCSMGAVRSATRDPSMETKAITYLAQAIGAADYLIVGWNDSAKRKKPQVLRAFDRAIKTAKRDANTP